MALKTTETEMNASTSMAGTDPARADLEEAFAAISNKRKDLDTLFGYFDGPQPLKYSTAKLQELFRDINTHFEINWCEVVVSSTLDRLELEGFTVTGNDTAGEQLTDLFTRLHLDLEADDAHQASLATSQAYMIVWKDADGLQAFYNDPRMCHVFYEDANPRKKRFAAKWFNRTDGRQEITLYYPDRLEHWVSVKQQTFTALDKPSAFSLESSETNTFGVIPVFELKSPGEIFKILTIQDAVNKLFADMMTAAEFGSVLQRYVISQSDPGRLKNAPNEIWWIPSGDGQGQGAQVGTLEATVLSNFSSEMDKLANAIAIITRTPKHYFMATGANISGEALLAMESPLTKKAMKRQKRFGAQWQDIAAFIAQLEGLTIAPDDIKPIWKRPESIQPLTEMQTVQTGTGAGVDVETMLLHEGWDEKEVAEMNKRKQANLRKRVNTVRVPVDDNGTMPVNGENNARQNPAG
jgi:hypothetical protein